MIEPGFLLFAFGIILFIFRPSLLKLGIPEKFLRILGCIIITIGLLIMIIMDLLND